MRGPARVASEAGSALVYVLWIALILSVLMAGAALFARQQIISARIEQIVLRERLALQSALDLVAYRGAIAGRAYLEGLPETVEIAAYGIRVDHAPRNSRLDINLADETAWMRLFGSVGADEELARQLTDQILDWRDSDAEPRPSGAESEAYEGVADKQIANRSFFSIAELGQVRDITPARLDCIGPYLTVFGGTGPAQGAPLDGLDLPARSDGVRVALRAIIIAGSSTGRELTGVVQYGTSQVRPYEWVQIGSEDGVAPPCPDSVF